ncbi:MULTISPECIES: hypothetical protein [Pseudovibrio]|uniref:hypothetical protein n=1 Tax=Stappiaceae TaxID=2821832 RepID=UPI002366B119|nr:MULTISPECIES: hypothetical protein [Pseudovibrio]MDD7910238.1 hypothetical protein [Pseudovibrio exalbescens]MDX5593951.1 hypothetical protein [Pseudovibrio sp. SPO723]
MPSAPLKTTVSALALLTAVSLPAFAFEQSPNARVAAGFGALDGDLLGLVSGNYVAQLQNGFAAQFDAAAGGETDYGFVGGSVRLGFRQYDAGYFGVIASGTHINRNDGDIGFVGAEGQMHFGPVSLDAMIGLQGFDDDGDVVGAFDVSYYMTENLRFYGGYRHFRDDNVYAAGAEFRPGSFGQQGIAIYGDARLREDDDATFLVGGRLSFSGNRSLMQENRNDYVNRNYILDELISE